MRHQHRAARLAAALVLASAPGVVDASADASLTGGWLDRSHAAVVAVMRGDHAECSGVLVAPRLVVTAAHCVHAGDTVIAVGLEPGAATARRAVVVQDPHPRFDGQTSRHDLAVMVLAEPLREPTPLAVAAELPAELLVGATLTVVGYGHGEEPAGHLRRVGTVRVTAVTPEAIETEAFPAQACVGDSGGAALAVIDGREVLVGIMSRAEHSCTGWGKLTRVDVAWPELVPWWLARLSPGATATGEACWFAEQCASGLCTTGVGPLGFCAAACASDRDCPAPMGCAAGRCDYGDQPSPGNLGAACADARECATSMCAAAREDVARCTRWCDPAEADACPDGFACVERAGDAPGQVCAPSTGGCSAGGGAGPALGLVLGAVLRRRRRPQPDLAGPASERG